MITSIYKKGTQAVNYFARKKDGKINKMKAIKLIYLADRYHLRKYGRPIIGDEYWAMKYGPVGSSTLNIVNLSEDNIGTESIAYVKEYIGHTKGDTELKDILSKKEVELGVFSQSDIDAFEKVYKEFGDKDRFELADITHKYPEWSKFKTEIDGGKRRAKMDYLDFFKDSKNTGSSIFATENNHLDITKEIYLENKEVANLLG